MNMWVIDHSYLIPLLPLIGAAISGFFGARWLKGQSHWPIWLTVGASAVMSFILLTGMYQQMPQRAHHEAEIQDVVPHGVNSTVPANTADHFILAKPVRYFTWIQAGDFKADFGFFLDPLSATMLCVVCGIGFVITVFAAGYMKGEEGYFRFFSYLGLFIFSMTCLVMGENLLMLFLGWEGVGLCSYLLIGYYYNKPSAREAAKKAFITNRVGDLGFALGIMLTYTAFGTISFFGMNHDGFLTQVNDLTQVQKTAVSVIPFLLMVGAFGKSAQFPLYVWLPDAMEGPTPVSALIHAATMVTAGVYMILRCLTIFVSAPGAMMTVAIVGAFTAIFAGSIALRQFDLKKVFAYSTVSQLGFMFVAAGTLAPVAGLFHLITHAFFKALLFLGSGVVMHAMAGELDMRKMSGLKTVLPKTRWLMLAGCLALAGVIPLSGFWSKDEILIAAWDRSKFLGVVMLLTALMTAYYTFRLYFRVFEGPTVVPEPPASGGHGSADSHVDHDAHGHDDHAHQQGQDHGKGHDSHGHNHEPGLMIFPLVILAIGALLAGGLNLPSSLFGEHGTEKLAEFVGHSPSLSMGFNVAKYKYGKDIYVDPVMFGQLERGEEPAPAMHMFVMAASIGVSLLGILLAYQLHLKERAKGDALAERFPNARRLLEAKYYVDEIYQRGIIEPLRFIGNVFYAIDRWVIGGIVGAAGLIPQFFGFVLKLTTQRGSLQGYALLMIAGIIIILTCIFC